MCGRVGQIVAAKLTFIRWRRYPREENSRDDYNKSDKHYASSGRLIVNSTKFLAQQLNYRQAFIEPQSESHLYTLSFHTSYTDFVLYIIPWIQLHFGQLYSWWIQLKLLYRSSHHHPPLHLHTIRWGRVSCYTSSLNSYTLVGGVPEAYSSGFVSVCVNVPQSIHVCYFNFSFFPLISDSFVTMWLVKTKQTLIFFLIT